MSKHDRFSYPAVFEYGKDGSIGVTFPDLPGCVTDAANEAEAFRCAKEALSLHLYGMEQDGEEIPSPSKAHEVVYEREPDSSYATVLIEVWMIPFRYAMDNKAVKKTLSIPKWLNDLAEENKINFSQVLQSALKQYLGIL